MNFGYHILTETIGLAFALGSCYFLYNLICQVEKRVLENRQGYFYYKDWRVFISIFLLFVIIQVLSFFTGETVWFVFLFLIYIVIKRKLYKWMYLPLVVLIFLVLVVAKIPQSVFSQSYSTHIPKFSIDFLSLIKPKYIIDSVIKLGLTFNISWLIFFPAIFYLLKKKLTNVHEFFIGWTIAALGYIAAGYVHNSLLPNGYPLRMLFSLFPLIYLLCIEYFEKKISPPKLIYVLSLFFILHVCISVSGVLLDSGAVTIHTIFDIFN